MNNENIWYVDEASANESGMRREYISEGGCYIGKLTRCDELISRNGTVGAEFDFESEDGEKARFLTLWFRTRDGNKIFGTDLMNALGKLLNLPLFEKVRTDARAERGYTGMGYPVVCNKPIGVILQKEFYTKGDGSEGYKMNIVDFVHATTKQTWGEYRDKAEARDHKRIPKDKYRTAGAQGASGARYNTTPTSNHAADADNDLPF